MLNCCKIFTLLRTKREREIDEIRGTGGAVVRDIRLTGITGIEMFTDRRFPQAGSDRPSGKGTLQ